MGLFCGGSSGFVDGQVLFLTLTRLAHHLTSGECGGGGGVAAAEVGSILMDNIFGLTTFCDFLSL